MNERELQKKLFQQKRIISLQRKQLSEMALELEKLRKGKSAEGGDIKDLIRSWGEDSLGGFSEKDLRDLREEGVDPAAVVQHLP